MDLLEFLYDTAVFLSIIILEGFEGFPSGGIVATVILAVRFHF
jgi:hypothetical protein